MTQVQVMKSSSIPEILYEGGSIDVLWDYHDEAVKWYQKYLGWNIQQQETWTADPRATHGKMTHMGWGTWLISSISQTRLPYHFAERGTIDSNVRWCWRTGDLLKSHAFFKENGIRVTDIYRGPGECDYFDFWATYEGVRLTAQGDSSVNPDVYEPSWTRIGVSNLKRAVEWYRTFLGMSMVSVHEEENYVIMRLGLNHHPEESSLWIIEQLPEGAAIGKVDGTVRSTCWIQNREQFFNYYQALKECGIHVGEIGGFTTRGMVSFHLYDEDGNRFNISSM